MTGRLVPDLSTFLVNESYGSSGRVGLVTVGSTLETPLYEFYLMVPKGVAVVSRHMQIRTVDRDSTGRALHDLAVAAEELAHYSVDVVVVLGGPVAYMDPDPLATAERIRSTVERASGARTIFEWTASMSALRSLGLESLAVATPFVEANNRQLAAAMTADGFVVKTIQGAGLRGNPDFTIQPLRTCQAVVERAMETAGDVDGIFIACPRWPVLPLVDELESQFGLPVVASNQSWVWALSREMGPSFPVKPVGRLFAA